MTCIICKQDTSSGKFVFIGEQKCIICEQCNTRIEKEVKRREEEKCSR